MCVSRYVIVGDSELVLSVYKIRVRCGMPMATLLRIVPSAIFEIHHYYT